MTDKHPHVDSDWYQETFGDFYAIVYAHRTIEAAAPEAAFAAQQLELQASDVTLDLCCGTGRHLIHLAQRTPHAYGLDYSPALLARATQTLEGRARLVRADMKAVPFANAFDVVTSFFTSFGYFDDDADNEHVLGEIARILRPGGRYFLDHVNVVHLRKTLEPASVRENGPYEIRESRWIDEERQRINKTTRVFRNGAALHESEESVRLYSREELTAILVREGLTVQHVYGDYEGAPYDAVRPRMLFVGHKD